VSVQGQRYSSSGSAVGSEFQVNSYTTNYQGGTSVAAGPDGDFVVVWTSGGSFGSDTSDRSVQCQRYDSGGAALGGEFQVNTYTTDVQGFPSVAVDPSGGFVVVWTSRGSFDGDNGVSVQGQRYDSGGNALGSQFQVNSYTTGSQSDSSVAADPAGDFVVVWQSLGSSGGDTSDLSIQGQRFTSAGSVVGNQFQVNTYTTNAQYRPSVTAQASGAFVVVWAGYGSPGDSDLGVRGQRYDSSGNAVGSEFQVNTYTTSPQRSPSIAAQATGDFVVVWDSEGSFGGDTDSYSVQGQFYDSSGSAVGSEFQINTYTTSFQGGLPSVAADADGDFVVVWTSEGSFGGDNGSSIQGQRFTAAAAKVPSLSPAGLAAAALLLCLAVALALRRA
jgi:hypothetical protein